eukprot:3039649-Rhodomonas_salina.1
MLNKTWVCAYAYRATAAGAYHATAAVLTHAYHATAAGTDGRVWCYAGDRGRVHSTGPRPTVPCRPRLPRPQLHR